MGMINYVKAKVQKYQRYAEEREKKYDERLEARAEKAQTEIKQMARRKKLRDVINKRDNMKYDNKSQFFEDLGNTFDTGSQGDILGLGGKKCKKDNRLL